MRLARHVECMVDRTDTYRDMLGRPDRMRPLARSRHRWNDNIKVDLQEVRWGGMDWIILAQDRDRWRALVDVVMNLRVT